MRQSYTLLIALGLLGATAGMGQSQPGDQHRSAEYGEVQAQLQQGWNTWDNDSVMGEVLLPQGLEIRVGFKQNTTENADAFLPAALIGRRKAGEEEVHPGPHAYDGSYGQVRVTWHGYSWEVESAHTGGDLVMLVTSIARPKANSLPPSVVFSAGMLWNRDGSVGRDGDRLMASIGATRLPIYLAGQEAADMHIPIAGPYFSALLERPVGVSTGSRRTLTEVQEIVARQRQAFTAKHASRNDQATEVSQAIETTIAWDTIYEPAGQRVITPVSRIWNQNWGGYVLFDWDTFFAADLAGVDNRKLAYANVIEILNETSAEGFVPNYGRAGAWKSSDRSEPPVGAMTVLGLYNKFGDRWLLEQTFAKLLRWNRWWTAHRMVEGYLCWGSDGANSPSTLTMRAEERCRVRGMNPDSTTAQCTTRPPTTGRPTPCCWRMSA